MKQGDADLSAFEEFQQRAFQTALLGWLAALLAALVFYRAFSPVLGGLVIGGAASLAAFRYRVWALRRLAAQPTAQVARRMPLVAGAGRYAILAAALALAAWLAVIDDAGYLAATVAALFLCNAATIVQAVREARRH